MGGGYGRQTPDSQVGRHEYVVTGCRRGSQRKILLGLEDDGVELVVFVDAVVVGFDGGEHFVHVSAEGRD